MGVTGERSAAAVVGRDRRRHGRQRGRRAAVAPAVATPAGVGPERLEDRTLFSAAATAAVSFLWKGSTVRAYQDQWVVQTDDPARFQAVAAKQGFTGVTGLGGGYYQFTSADTPAQMRTLSGVFPLALGKVQPNRVVTAASLSQPNDAALANQWGLINTGQLESFDYNGDGVVTPYDQQTYTTGLPTGTTSDYPASSGFPDENQVGTAGGSGNDLGDIDAQQAWGITHGATTPVIVAVLDTGVDLTQPDLVGTTPGATGNIWTNPLDTTANGNNGDGYANDIHGYDFYDLDADPTDDNGHGTHVAGIIGAIGNNGIGVSGVNWDVSMIPVKVLGADGTGSDATVIAGINYVINLKDHGINVVAINESLGAEGAATDPLETRAVQAAGKAGILTIVAAGNSGTNDDTLVTSPASLAASEPDVITVAATDNQGRLATFSNYGSSTVDLAAPGVNIFSTLPTTGSYYLADQANATLLTTPAYYLPPQVVDAQGNALSYGYLSGTSQAAAFVTGTIALEAAANPAATPAQLKHALLENVTYDPNLAANNGAPAKVSSQGVLNAYRAVLGIRNDFVSTDTTRQGSWVGQYGTLGAYVVGDTAAFPTLLGGTASITAEGGSPVIVQDTTKNAAALQRTTDPSSRISAYEGSATSETINVDFGSDTPYRVRLYVLDPDHKKRSEQISIVDATTGLTVDVEGVTNFSKGEYLSWDLRGSVRIVITNISGGAAWSGLFFDPADAAPATFYNLDTTTSGPNWRSMYGSQGDLIFGDNGQSTNTLPSYVDTTNFASAFAVGGKVDVLRSSTKAAIGLQRNFDVTTNVEAYYESATHFDVNLAFTDAPLIHTVTLFAADYDNKHRTEQIQEINTATGSILATENLSNFKNGQYVTFNVSGDVTFRVTNTGGPNAVLSGVFFDAPFGETAHYVGTDSTTQGNWSTSNLYGSGEVYLAGYNMPGVDVPTNSILQVAGTVGRGVVASRTNNVRAPLIPGAAGANQPRVAAYAFTTSSMSFTYTPGDVLQHQLALYFVDYEKLSRVQTVSLYNATTGTLLTQQTLSNFANGKYLVFDVTGPIKVVVTAQKFPNAVLSGVFID